MVLFTVGMSRAVRGSQPWRQAVQEEVVNRGDRLYKTMWLMEEETNDGGDCSKALILPCPASNRSWGTKVLMRHLHFAFLFFH